MDAEGREPADNMDRDELESARTDDGASSDAPLPMARPSPWRLSAWLWSLLALLGGLAVTLLVYQQQQQRHLAEQSFVRSELAGKTFSALQGKLHSAEAMLRAVQTLFLASDEVTQTEFASFYTNLRPREQFPSLLALRDAVGRARCRKCGGDRSGCGGTTQQSGRPAGLARQ